MNYRMEKKIRKAADYLTGLAYWSGKVDVPSTAIGYLVLTCDKMKNKFELRERNEDTMSRVIASGERRDVMRSLEKVLVVEHEDDIEEGLYWIKRWAENDWEPARYSQGDWEILGSEEGLRDDPLIIGPRATPPSD